MELMIEDVVLVPSMLDIKMYAGFVIGKKNDRARVLYGTKTDNFSVDKLELVPSGEYLKYGNHDDYQEDRPRTGDLILFENAIIGDKSFGAIIGYLCDNILS